MAGKAGLMIDLAATQASLAALRKARKRDAPLNDILFDFAQVLCSCISTLRYGSALSRASYLYPLNKHSFLRRVRRT